MSNISLLAELQNVDLRHDENARARAELEKSLADSNTLNAARADLENTDTRTNTLHAHLRALELETGTLTEKLKQVNERLYSGRITNAKELAGLNEDEKMLQRRKRELEDQELALMEQIENADHTLKQKRAAFETESTETQKRHDKERAALHERDASDAELAAKRENICAQLDASTLRVYDNLRATKKGRALAHIKNSACGACGYAVPGGLVARVKAGNELVFCANCERILAP